MPPVSRRIPDADEPRLDAPCPTTQATGVSPETLRLRTTRLELIAATLEMALAERDDRARLERDHGIRLALPWPPPLNDEASLAWSISVLREMDAASGAGWGFWYFTLPAAAEGDPALAIGNGGFKGGPDQTGTVEIGYSVLEEYQRRGYASEAVEALVAWAFLQRGVRRIIAETYPVLIGSIGVLRKARFRQVGPASDEGVIRFERLL
jgi:ribosomal-protein-alanine N-acetyltransferase